MREWIFNYIPLNSYFHTSLFKLPSLNQKVITAFFLVLVLVPTAFARPKVHALYIPLADHYAALVAYERYSDKMKHADFQIEQMKNWDLLRAYFQSGEVDMAFVMSPLAMDMFRQEANFRWIGLMHRDGNALAINEKINQYVDLAPLRKDRKPDAKVANALGEIYRESGKSTPIGMPHLLATHTVVLYQYLKNHKLKLAIGRNQSAPVTAISIAPSKSPIFLRANSNRAQAAAFEQSLPWADIVETGGYGRIAWYSKDVISHPYGHVECIALATDKAISTKEKAIQEVMYFIHQAGADIEHARQSGGEDLDEIVDIIRKHIPSHNKEAIIASLDPKLRVINYEHLNVDKAGLQQIMELGVEGGILRQRINIDEFADMRFEVDLSDVQ